MSESVRNRSLSLTAAPYIEYTSKVAEAERKRQQVAEMELEFNDLRGSVRAFLIRYKATVGQYEAELAAIELEIDEVKLRTARLPVRGSPAGMDRQADEMFHERRGQTHGDNERAGEAGQESAEPADADERKRLRALYRELAKRYHPDLAESDESRERLSGIMVDINEAYGCGDLAALEGIADRLASDHACRTASRVEERIRALDANMHRLDEVKDRLAVEIAALRESEAFRLLMRVRRSDEGGWDLLQEICSDLEDLIAVRTEVLDACVARYQTLVAERSGGGPSDAA